MKLLDLKVLHEKDVRWQIRKVCGGKLRFRERLTRKGIGIGGMYYESGVAEIDDHLIISDPLRANVELLKNGFGFYFINSRQHYLILVPQKELEMVHLFRDRDTTIGLNKAELSALGIDIESPKQEEDNLKMRILLFDGMEFVFKFINHPEQRIIEQLGHIFGGRFKS